MNILFAEDVRAIALPIIAFLEQQGHQVTYVSDGQAAVEAFTRQPPHLVLMDIVMPMMDGIEATRRIKALGGTRWIPVILMTSLSAHDEIVAGLEAGADDYLIKPTPLAILQARIASMQRIATMQESLHGILDNVYEGILTIDEQGLIQSFNQAAERIFGYRPAEVIGKNVSMLMPAPYAREHDGYIARYLREGQPHIIGIGRKVEGLRKNGEVFPMRLAVTEVQRGGGRRWFIGLVSDISAEEAARARIEFLAHHDVLTGLPNRGQFNARLEVLCGKAQTAPFAVLFIDLDGFKPINDTLGHEAGDEALKIIAQRLRHTLAAEDFVARLGGDEFVALCQDIASAETAQAIGQRLLAAVSQPMRLQGVPSQLGASIGIALWPQHGRTASELLTAADHAMYAAKRQGKGQVVLAAPRPA
ncbi:MAG: diguanylate cyclase [Rhodocyclaceae bacterium]|nr:diguanylate cyclase [Rhodocyclaceae bacterium]